MLSYRAAGRLPAAEVKRDGRDFKASDESVACFFYAHARIWNFSVKAACAPRGEQQRREFPCSIIKRNPDVTEMIGARVLNISSQDYELQGSSVTILIADESKVPMGDTTVAHLDKSHITVHTCPLLSGWTST